MRRRQLLAHAAVSAATLGVPALTWSRSVPPSHALRAGVDPLAAGLADALRRRFAAYSGLALQLQVGPSALLLEALERGELDAALTMAPDAEQQLVQQGLAHDRQRLADAELLLVGPTDGAVVAPGGRDIVDALRRIAAAGAPMLGRDDGSGVHLAEQALWRAAGIAPAAPWHVAAGDAPLARARAQRAFVLADRAGWREGARRERYGVLVEGDARLHWPLHVLRSFRSGHSASRLAVGWIGGREGRRVVAAQRGWRAVADTARS